MELEYALVDAELRPNCLVETLLRHVAGRPLSEFQSDGIGFSNELSAHVLELKTIEPIHDLTGAEARLVQGVRFVAEVLREKFGGRLLPTGMHPLMSPGDTTLWPRAGRRIYETYARIFSIREHGWMNVQSSQINLPFGDEGENVLLHNAIAIILPYLPALAASSPLVEGQRGPCVDSRLAFYKSNQRRLSVITGGVVPEYMKSYAQYNRDVLGRIYRALDDVEGGARLRHEWVNSRGVIPRFKRKAFEIRILDLQECVKMDVAIAAFVRAALKGVVHRLRGGSLRLPERSTLLEDFDAVVARGSRARVRAAHLLLPANVRRSTSSPTAVLERLLEFAAPEATCSDRVYLGLIANRLREGNLSERILRVVSRGVRGDAQRRVAIRRVYGELADCLERNTPWPA